MAYGDFEYWPRRTASDKALCDKAFNSAKYPKYDGYQRGPASVVYKFFDKKSFSGGSVKNLLNLKLAKGCINQLLENSKNKKWKIIIIIKKMLKKKKKKSTLMIQTHYLGCWSCWCAIDN